LLKQLMRLKKTVVYIQRPTLKDRSTEVQLETFNPRNKTLFTEAASTGSTIQGFRKQVPEHQ